jgi:DNA-binding NtrC family response regulator
MIRMRILIVHSDTIELSLMAAALADSYDVLAARDMEEALFFLNRIPPCRLACFEVGSDVEAAVSNMRELGKSGMEIIALIHPPCPRLVREAIKAGRIQGLCLLPIDIQHFTTIIRKFTSKLYHKKEDNPSHHRILTKEEISFLLGSPLDDIR